MSDYIKTTDFAAKDALASGNPNKIASGTQIDTEFNNLATAIASKLDESGGTVGGTLTVSSTLTVDGNLTLSGDLTTDNNSASEVGFKGSPQNAQTVNYTLVLTDAGKDITHTSGAGAGDTFTIPANSSVAFPIGTIVLFTNLDSNNLTIAITSDTLTLAGTTSTGSRTLAQNSWCAAKKVSSTAWLIGGVGLT